MQAFLYLFFAPKLLPLINSPPKKQEIKKTFTAYTEYPYISSYWWPLYGVWCHFFCKQNNDVTSIVLKTEKKYKLLHRYELYSIRASVHSP